MNIKSQWDYLGNAILIYEAREENSIQSPKAICYGMQKNQEFREYKLRLLHKLNGFDTLMYVFPEIHTRDYVNRYKGYHVFDSSEDITRRHKVGKALSSSLYGKNPILYVSHFMAGIKLMMMEMMLFITSLSSTRLVASWMTKCQVYTIADSRRGQK